MNHVRGYGGAMRPTRAHRTPQNPYRRKRRERINWGLCLMLAGAMFLTLLTLAYKFAGPV